jgi:hypothetical protein
MQPFERELSSRKGVVTLPATGGVFPRYQEIGDVYVDLIKAGNNTGRFKSFLEVAIQDNSNKRCKNRALYATTVDGTANKPIALYRVRVCLKLFSHSKQNLARLFCLGLHRLSSRFSSSDEYSASRFCLAIYGLYRIDSMCLR